MGTIELMLETLNKQIYSGYKIYLVTLERPEGNIFTRLTTQPTAQAALTESQGIYPDCLVLKVTLNRELVA